MRTEQAVVLVISNLIFHVAIYELPWGLWLVANLSTIIIAITAGNAVETWMKGKNK